MRSVRSGFVVSVLALLATPVAAQPVQANFELCDGYRAPDSKNDGMTRGGTMLFGLVNGTLDIRPEDRAFGKAAFRSCEAALASDLLLPGYKWRRANLYQAKALNALAIADYPAALAAAGESDAVGGDDQLMGASLGLGNHAIRAYALAKSGRQSEAEEQIRAIETKRPWSASLRRLASLLRHEMDPGAGMASFLASLPLAPDNAPLLYWDALLKGDYDQALKVAPAVAWELPTERGAWTYEGEAARKLFDIEVRAEFQGSLAFAQAFKGDNAAADRLFAQAEAALDDALAPPPDRAPGKPPRQSDVDAWNSRKPYAARGKEQLALWREARRLVTSLRSLSLEAGFAAVEQSRARELPIVPAMLDSLQAATADEKAAKAQILDEYRKRTAAEQRAAMTFDVKKLAGLLPRHMTDKMLPVLKKAGDGYFLSDTGLSKRREAQADVWTVRFVHPYAPIQVLEELVMFGAATTAKEQGKDALLVISRRSASRVIQTVSYYGGDGDKTNAGYEAHILVRFVDSANLPPELAGSADRLIKVQTIINDTSKRFRQSGGMTLAW